MSQPDDESTEDMSIENRFEILEKDNSEYQDVIDNDSEVNDSSTQANTDNSTQEYIRSTPEPSVRPHRNAVLPHEIQSIAAETISDDLEYESANESSNGENSNYSDEINHFPKLIVKDWIYMKYVYRTHKQDKISPKTTNN